jgi:hypothetical protein
MAMRLDEFAVAVRRNLASPLPGLYLLDDVPRVLLNG